MEKILIVEDERAISELVAFSCKTAGFSAVQTGSAEEADQQLRSSVPDLIILDWMLPGCSGLEWLVRLRSSENYSNVPVILLTARGSESDRVSGLEAGADDYVVKPFSPRELVARIRAVLRRRSSSEGGKSAGKEVSIGPLAMNEERFEALVDGTQIRLGVIEFKILFLMASHPGRVFSRGQLLSLIWDSADEIDERTVDVHILRLRKQLAKTSACSMVETVRGLGYRVVNPH
ncbi:response regulator [Mesosutterella sp. AGMB02718]|uniref:Response regulator n=1 Tax=Mesosutterella faecium TaxID=2925194 RepID=A0ABT7ILB2_9BURK|nr:response regulator [Mesosutterella sp. AGMB02718]MDL2059152.1 response regulator [Mesosutterella sp. AGMB02718]